MAKKATASNTAQSNGLFVFILGIFIGGLATLMIFNQLSLLQASFFGPASQMQYAQPTTTRTNLVAPVRRQAPVPSSFVPTSRPKRAESKQEVESVRQEPEVKYQGSVGEVNQEQNIVSDASGVRLMASIHQPIPSDILVAGESNREVLKIRLEARGESGARVKDIYLENDVNNDERADNTDVAGRVDFKLYNAAGKLVQVKQMDVWGKLHFELFNADAIQVPKNNTTFVTVRVDVRDVEKANQSGERLRLSLDVDSDDDQDYSDELYRGIRAQNSSTGVYLSTPSSAPYWESSLSSGQGSVTGETFVIYKSQMGLYHATRGIQQLSEPPSMLTEVYRFVVVADGGQVEMGRVTLDIRTSGMYRSGTIGTTAQTFRPSDFEVRQVDSSGRVNENITVATPGTPVFQGGKFQMTVGGTIMANDDVAITLGDGEVVMVQNVGVPGNTTATAAEIASKLVGLHPNITSATSNGAVVTFTVDKATGIRVAADNAMTVTLTGGGFDFVRLPINFSGQRLAEGETRTYALRMGNMMDDVTMGGRTSVDDSVSISIVRDNNHMAPATRSRQGGIVIGEADANGTTTTMVMSDAEASRFQVGDIVKYTDVSMSSNSTYVRIVNIKSNAGANDTIVFTPAVGRSTGDTDTLSKQQCIIWSDESAQSHSTAAVDWQNGYLMDYDSISYVNSDHGAGGSTVEEEEDGEGVLTFAHGDNQPQFTDPTGGLQEVYRIIVVERGEGAAKLKGLSFGFQVGGMLVAKDAEFRMVPVKRNGELDMSVSAGIGRFTGSNTIPEEEGFTNAGAVSILFGNEKFAKGEARTYALLVGDMKDFGGHPDDDKIIIHLRSFNGKSLEDVPLNLRHWVTTDDKSTSSEGDAELSVSRSDGFMPQQKIIAGVDDVTVMEVLLKNEGEEDVEVQGLRFVASGTGNAITNYSTFVFAPFVDNIQQGSGKRFSLEGGTAYLAFEDLSFVVPRGGQKEVQLLFDTAEEVAPGTMTLSLVNVEARGKDSITEAAVKNGGGDLGTGSPIKSAEFIFLEGGTLSVERGSGFGSELALSSSNNNLLQLNLRAGGDEMQVKEFTFSNTGGSRLSQYLDYKLYNGSGQLVQMRQSDATGKIVFQLSNADRIRVSAGGSSSVLVKADVRDGAPEGESFQLRLDDLDVVTASTGNEIADPAGGWGNIISNEFRIEK